MPGSYLAFGDSALHQEHNATTFISVALACHAAYEHSIGSFSTTSAALLMVITGGDRLDVGQSPSTETSRSVHHQIKASLVMFIIQTMTKAIDVWFRQVK